MKNTYHIVSVVDVDVRQISAADPRAVRLKHTHLQYKLFSASSNLPWKSHYRNSYHFDYLHSRGIHIPSIILLIIVIFKIFFDEIKLCKKTDPWKKEGAALLHASIDLFLRPFHQTYTWYPHFPTHQIGKMRMIPPHCSPTSSTAVLACPVQNLGRSGVKGRIPSGCNLASPADRHRRGGVAHDSKSLSQLQIYLTTHTKIRREK